jgi:hypothetical protein
MHINENIFNNLPKCTTYSSEGEVRAAASTHTALEARKRGGVKREEKHYTLHTAKLHYFSGTWTSLPRSLSRPTPLPTMRSAACVVLPKLPESGATYVVDCAYQLRAVNSLVAGYMNAQCAKSINLILINVLFHRKAYFVNVV